MKILFLDEKQEAFDKLAPHMTNWGYEVAHLLAKDDVLPSLRGSQSSYCLLMSAEVEGVLNLVRQLRGLEGYTYLIMLMNAEQGYEDELALLGAGADQVLYHGFQLSYLKAKIQTANRLINSKLFGFLERTQPKSKKSQVLDLDLAMEYVNGEKSLYKDLVDVLLQNVQDMKVDNQTLALTVWEDLRQGVEHLGVTELIQWLDGLIQMKERVRNLEGVRLQHLQQQFEKLVMEIRTAIECLDRFGYFRQFSHGDGGEQLEGRRILLVEDMIHNRILVKQILKPRNPEIVEAVNGLEAVKAWHEQGPFDLIMMDMNMPIMDGFEATKQIRQLEQEIKAERTPILALTALAMRGDQEKCLNAGCDGYIPKPVEPRNLLSVASQLIGDFKVASCHLPSQKRLHIDQIGLATENQVYQHALSLALSELSIPCKILHDRPQVLEALAKQSYDLLILDSEYDLDLAYFAKAAYPNQQLSLICQEDEVGKFLYDNLSHVIQYPFELSKVQHVVDYHSEKLNEGKKFQHILEDFNSLKGLKGQGGIAETMAKSADQLAVWQKAFRKIGGDLVLAHQFNLHGKFGLVLADVSGHDVQSGYTASWFAGLVKGIWNDFPAPVDLLTHLNKLFAQESEEEDKRYVCALALLWDPLRQTLHYANAGIPSGILLKQQEGREIQMIHWKGAPVGMFPDLEMFDYGSLPFRVGDRLVLATDGVLENIPESVIASLSWDKGEHNAQKTLDTLVDFIVRSMVIKDDLTLAVFDAKAPAIPQNGYRNSIESTMEATYEEIKRLKAYVESLAPVRFDWPMIGVAVKEALINGVEHGNKNKAERPVDVDAYVDERGRLVVAVSDCGSGFDINREKRRIESEGQLRIQGRGLQLIEHIAQEIEFQGGGIKMFFQPEK